VRVEAFNGGEMSASWVNQFTFSERTPDTIW